MRYLITDAFIAFLVTYSVCIPLLDQSNSLLLWFMLAVIHDSSHILNPASIQVAGYYIQNIYYIPLYSYIIRSIQCLCVLLIDPSFALADDRRSKYSSIIISPIIGIPLGVYVIIAYVDYHETLPWFILLISEIYGSIIHMLLLYKSEGNPMVVRRTTRTLICFNVLIWMIMYLTQESQLSRVWYLSYLLMVRYLSVN